MEVGIGMAEIYFIEHPDKSMKKYVPKQTRLFFNLATSVSRLWGENQLISVTRAMAASSSGSITVCEAVI